MRWNDIDFQILLEIGHVLSNVHQAYSAREPSSPCTAINRAEHDIILCLDCSVESSPYDDPLQFASVGDERLAEQAKAARLVEKRQSRHLGIANMDDQWKFSNSRRSVACRAPRESLPNVRIEDERVSWRLSAEAARRLTLMYWHARFVEWW